MKKEAFGAYGIRGTYPDQVNEQLFYDIGRAFVLFRKTKKVYIGRDLRTHSASLAHSLAEGLQDQGATVVDLGLISTPMAYLASRNGDVLMVTASHNPPAYNGIKIVLKGTTLIGGNQLKKIKSLLGKRTDVKRGKLIRKTILRRYIRTILEHASHISKLNVVLDAGNGTGALTLPKLLEQLPIHATLLDFTPDGTFPHHDANPALNANVADCSQMVKLKRANLGVSFDGDMDEIRFVDEHGTIIPSDIIMALFAAYELKTHPKRAVVFDLRASRALSNAVLAAGGQLIVSKVGHPAIVNKMKRHRAILGGELSGHFYFKDYFGVESADLAFVKMLTILSKTNIPLSALVAPYYQYENSGELSFKVADKTRTLSAIKKAFIDGRISRTDGLTIEYPDAWFNVRASNTEPVLRLVIEASTKERLEELKAKLLKFLK